MSDRKRRDGTVIPLQSARKPGPTMTEELWNSHRLGFFGFALVAQLVIIVAFAFTVDYSAIASGNESDDSGEAIVTFYPFFQVCWGLSLIHI